MLHHVGNKGPRQLTSFPSAPLASPKSDMNRHDTRRKKMNLCFLPAHHPPKAIIRDVLRGGLEVIFGGGLVIQQRPTAGLTVRLLAQAVREGIIPGEKETCELGVLHSRGPRMCRAPQDLSERLDQHTPYG